MMGNKHLLDMCQMALLRNGHCSLVGFSEMSTEPGGVVPVIGVLGEGCHR